MADVNAERRPDYFLAGSRPLARLEVHERAAAFAPLALRLSLAAIFLAHGIQKLLGLGAASAGFEQMGFSPGALWAPLTAALELLGGLALALGFFTRAAALLLLCSQLVALFLVHLPNGFFLKPEGNGIEFNVALIGSLLALVFLGSGRIGVDEEVRRKKGRTVYRERAVTPGETAARGPTPPTSDAP